MAEDAAPDVTFTAMPDRIGAQARARPDHISLIQGERRLTYRELNAMMDQVAATLQAKGVGVQEAIAICASSSIEYVAMFCGALRAGIVVAPLAPSSTAESLAIMIEDCGAKFLFIDAAVGAALLPVAGENACPRVSPDGSSFGQPLSRWLGPVSARPEAVKIQPDWSYNIIYSSGTTGSPKGIVQPHGYRSAPSPADIPFGYGPDAVTMISAGLYYNTTLVSLFPALGSGGTVVLMEKFDPGQFLKLSQMHRATHAMLVPVQYQRIMAHPEFDRFDRSTMQA